jgi:uncharacterized cupin superfamily protein
VPVDIHDVQHQLFWYIESFYNRHRSTLDAIAPDEALKLLAAATTMSRDKSPSALAIVAADAPPRTKASNYPEPFSSRMAKREKRALGDVFQLKALGVNHTTIAPGGESALLHRHGKQEELIYVLAGEPTLITDDGEMVLRPGMCAGFPANGHAHQLVNRTDADVIFLDIEARSVGDQVTYPNDDLEAVLGPNNQWAFAHKDGRPY